MSKNERSEGGGQSKQQERPQPRKTDQRIRRTHQRLGSAFVSGCSTAGRYPPALDITDMGWFEEGRQCSRIWHEGPQLEETTVTAGCPAVPPCQAHSVAFQVELLEP